MKRSEIDKLIDRACGFCTVYRFRLPRFAFWTARKWREMGSEADEIRRCKLGWDVTDFGSGDFRRSGLVLFTLRNGDPHGAETIKPYAEKIMIVEEEQVTPFHFHWKKTEDIINRAGGNLVVELFQADANEGFSHDPVTVSCDGIRRTVDAGGEIILTPGQSITLPPRLYHQFHGEKSTGTVLVGEVSSLNDDATDNRFKDPLPRFPAIEEDEEARRCLCFEYPNSPA